MATFRDSLDADFRSMLTGEFAEDAIVRASLSVVAHIRGIYDNNYLEIDPNTGATVASRKPRVTIFTGDVPFVIVQGATVTAQGRAYRVRDIQPDGFGGATLYLDQAKASDTNDVSTFEDDAPFPSESAAISADRTDTDAVAPDDAATWEGTGSRAESDAIALDDALSWIGAGSYAHDEGLPITEPAASLAGDVVDEPNRHAVEPTFAGDFLYSGAIDFGATPQPAVDKPMNLTVTRLGVPTQEVIV